MKYFKIEMSNGYCGCDETYLIKAKDAYEIDDYELLESCYSFLEPDERFIGYEEDYDSKEEYDEAYNEYNDNLSCFWEEIPKEEYEQLLEDGYPEI